MSVTAAAVSSAIIIGINGLLVLIQAQQEVNAGKRDYTPEELAMVDKLNQTEEGGLKDDLAAAKARLAGDPPPQ